MYIGETHRSWGDRMGEHLNALKTKNEAYATIRHHKEFHETDKDPMFTFHWVAGYGTSIERQIRESLLIDTYKCNNIVNGKGEWGANLVPRA